MATFASYPHPTMATTTSSSSNNNNNDDFTLYPYQEAWNSDQQYLASYADLPFLNGNTFDSYQTSQNIAALSEQFQFGAQQHLIDQTSKSIPATTQGYSPAVSASHSLDYQNPPVLSTNSDSGASALSSAMGSPSTQPQTIDWNQHAALSMLPGIVQSSDGLFATTSFDLETIPATDKGCVDPALIQPFSPQQFANAQYYDGQTFAHSPQNVAFPHATSPAPSRIAGLSPRVVAGKLSNAGSPYMRQQSWQPYPQHSGSRRPSISSVHSRHSHASHSSDDSNKGLCPIASCGRTVKDLKAHMLTHQNERPEKCPIPTCEYHTKGFARKYDKNRHTLTHYKGTMVCGFCPGSGSAAEKSFNRADVFKRHLTSVHGVEQTPPNARRKSPAASSKRAYSNTREASGICSTCGNNFASAQDFYEHLDDCVLRVVQQADPSEAINEKLLASVAEDKQVQETMGKHGLPSALDFNAPTSFDDEEEVEEEEDVDDEDTTPDSSRSGIKSMNKSKARKAGFNSQ